jgi:hypothetical protein
LSYEKNKFNEGEMYLDPLIINADFGKTVFEAFNNIIIEYRICLLNGTCIALLKIRIGKYKYNLEV